jgi:ATP-binding cassette subfamily B protein
MGCSSSAHAPPLPKEVWRHHVLSFRNPLLLQAIFAILLATFSLVAFGSVLRDVIDNGLNYAHPLNALVKLFLLALLLSFASFLRLLAVNKLGKKMAQDLQNLLCQKVMAQPYSSFEKHHLQNTMRHIHTDISRIQTLVVDTIPSGFRNALIALVSLISVFIISWHFAVCALGFSALVGLIIYTASQKARTHTKTYSQSERHTLNFIQDCLKGFVEIKSNNQETNTLKNLKELQKSEEQASLLQTKSRAITVLIVMTVCFTFVIFLIFIGSRLVESGQLSSGELTSFIFFALLATLSLNSLSESNTKYIQAQLSWKTIQDVLNLPNPVIVPSAKSYTFHHHIQVKDLSFSYPSAPQVPIFKNLNLDFKKGEINCIVGLNGSGKSTLLKLLLGLYPIDEGSIAIDGHPLNAIPPKGLNSMMSYAPQNTFFFSGTILSNLLLVDPDATEQRIQKVLKLCHLNRVIQSFEEGLKTEINSDNVTLSSGQKQRLALARAILKEADIYLFDEPTNHLDKETDVQLFKTFQKLKAEGKTLIIATHHFPLIVQSDWVHVIHQGECIQSGTPKSLGGKQGLYQALYEIEIDSKSLLF